MGLVCFSVVLRSVAEDPPRRLTRRTVLPGGRSDIRDRSVTVAMHMLRRVLLGEADEQPAQTAGADAAS